MGILRSRVALTWGLRERAWGLPGCLQVGAHATAPCLSLGIEGQHRWGLQGVFGEQRALGAERAG